MPSRSNGILRSSYDPCSPDSRSMRWVTGGCVKDERLECALAVTGAAKAGCVKSRRGHFTRLKCRRLSRAGPEFPRPVLHRTTRMRHRGDAIRRRARLYTSGFQSFTYGHAACSGSHCGPGPRERWTGLYGTLLPQRIRTTVRPAVGESRPMRASITAPAITRALREATWPARLLRLCGGEPAKRQGRAKIMGRRSEPRPCSRFSLLLIPSSVDSFIDTSAIALQLSGSAVGSAHR